jgi:hypothetical protein
MTLTANTANLKSNQRAFGTDKSRWFFHTSTVQAAPVGQMFPD